LFVAPFHGPRSCDCNLWSLASKKVHRASNNNANSRNMSAIGSENSQSTANGTQASRSSPPEYGVVSQRTITLNEAIKDNTDPTAQSHTNDASCVRYLDQVRFNS
jgi:hypothetical protein